MNYRHIYHAGNFADVLKHSILTRIILYLQRKDRGFRVIDTHAGPGLYDLGSDQAGKTGEWRSGIGRILDFGFDEPTMGLLSPYLSAIRECNPDGELKLYPGSPKLARLLLRRQDRLSAVELHPHDAKELTRLFDGDFQVRVTQLDGWLALGSHVPPKEKRGLVLVDPPFEQPGEFDRMVDGLARAHRRWPSGIYCLWYPIKQNAEIDVFHKMLKTLDIPKILCANIRVCDPKDRAGLAGSGLVVVNPPYVLEEELEIMLPALTQRLAQSDTASHELFWIASEAAMEF